MDLVKSVAKTLLLYFLLQYIAFFIFFRFWLLPNNYLVIFTLVQLFFYCIIFFFLVKNKNLFYNTLSGEKETKVNIPNKITLLRITMLPLLVFLTFVSQKHMEKTSHTGRVILTIAFAMTFATDAFDGRMARIKKQETYMGKILDSASDYLLLGIITIAFFYFKLIKPWLFLVIIIRLFLNALVMLILSLVQKKIHPQTTVLGKIAIAVIMVLLVLEAAKIPVLLPWIRLAEGAAAFLIGISIIDKIVYLKRGLKSALPMDFHN